MILTQKKYTTHLLFLWCVLYHNAGEMFMCYMGFNGNTNYDRRVSP